MPHRIANPAKTLQSWAHDSTVESAVDTGIEGPAPPRQEGTLPGDRYTRVALLGQGGMGEVWRVYDATLRRHVAMKILRSNRTGAARWERFLQEAQITGQLGHPGITPIHDLGRGPDGRPYFTMKEIRGRSLEAEIRASIQAEEPGSSGLSSAWPRLVGMLVRVCDAVSFAHARGVLHRDLKPGNVMIGEFGEVVVMDWGLARLGEEQDGLEPAVSSDLSDADVELSRAGTALGTPGYMAPEQARGDLERIGIHTDIFALGGLLYACLTGRAPIDGASAIERIERAREGRYQPPSAIPIGEGRVPRELEAVVLRAMAVDPADRYPTVEALRADLAHWLEGRPLATVRYSAGERVSLWLRRHRVTVRAVAAVAIAAALLGVAGVIKHVRDVDAEAARAREAEAAARLALAEGQLATGQALNASGQYEEARQVLRQSIAGLRSAGRPVLGAELALWETHHRAASPVVEIDAGRGDLIALDDRGERLLVVRDGEVSIRRPLEGRLELRRAFAGRPLKAAFEDGVPVVYAAAQGRLVRERIDTGAQQVLGPDAGDDTQWAFSPDGSVRLGATEALIRRAILYRDGLEPVDLGEGHTFWTDARRSFVSGYRSPAWLWDSRTGTRLRQVCDSSCRTVPSPDGTLLAVYDEFRYTLRLETLDRGELRWQLPVRSALHVIWSPDGHRLYVAGDQAGIRVLDAATGRDVGHLAGHDAGIAALAVGGPLVASLDTGGRLLLWSASPPPTGEVWHKYSTDSIAISDDRRLIALGFASGMQLIDPALGEKLLEVELPGVSGIQFVPGAPALWAWTKQGQIRVDLIDGRTETVDPQRFQVGLAIDGRLVRAGLDGTLSALDLGSGRTLWTRPQVMGGQLSMLLANPRTGQLAASGYPGRVVAIFDPETGIEQHRFKVGSTPYGVALALDGRAVAVGLYDHTARVFSLPDGLERTLEGHKGPVLAASFSPDGRHVLSGAFDFTLKVWDRQTGRLEYSEALATGAVGEIQWLDGRRLLTGHADGPVWIRDLELDGRLEAGRAALATGGVSPEEAGAVAAALDLHGLYAQAAETRLRGGGPDRTGGWLAQAVSLWRAGALDRVGEALEQAGLGHEGSERYRSVLSAALKRRQARVAVGGSGEKEVDRR